MSELGLGLGCIVMPPSTKVIAREIALILPVHQLWSCRAWCTYFQSLLSVAAHLLGLAARCSALSQTPAQTTSSKGDDWHLSCCSTLFALRAQGYLALRLPVCQPDRCPSAQMWVVWGRRGGQQNTAKSLCNQRVWLGGDGDSAGMQTFTIGQAVLVNRSGCTKEAGWIIDRV